MKLLEAHNGLSALLVEKSNYDGIWVSSLTHSASLGLPDNELVPLSERVDLVRQIRRVTTKPIFVDIDTGGDITHLPTIVKWFEQAGAHALIMEDKKFPKQNSLLEDGKKDLEEIDIFAEKIREAKKVKGIRIYARLESLIAKKSKFEAILRAQAYIEAGADGILIHSKEKITATEVTEVGNELRALYPELTLIAIPTTYTLPDEHPFNITIDANQMLRAAIWGMEEYSKGYMEDKGDMAELVSVQDIFNLVGK